MSSSDFTLDQLKELKSSIDELRQKHDVLLDNYYQLRLSIQDMDAKNPFRCLQILSLSGLGGLILSLGTIMWEFKKMAP